MRPRDMDEAIASRRCAQIATRLLAVYAALLCAAFVAARLIERVTL